MEMLCLEELFKNLVQNIYVIENKVKQVLLKKQEHILLKVNFFSYVKEYTFLDDINMLHTYV